MQGAVDWALRAVIVPHADHRDPAAHPGCLVCRAGTALGLLSAGVSQGEGHVAPPPEPSPVRWIELDSPAP